MVEGAERDAIPVVMRLRTVHRIARKSWTTSAGPIMVTVQVSARSFAAVSGNAAGNVAGKVSSAGFL